MLGHQRHNHRRVLRPLGFMHRNRISDGYLIQFVCIIANGPAIIVDCKLSFLLVKTANDPDISVVHFLLVIVYKVHDLVTDLVGITHSLNQSRLPV